MNKNFLIPIVSIIGLVIITGLYFYNKPKTISELLPQESTTPVVDMQNESKNKIIGDIVSISDTTIKIHEIAVVDCFYAFDYIWDDNNKLTKEEINKKYNKENLPWCYDPSGSDYGATGKDATFNFNDKTIFYKFKILEDKPISKKEFMQLYKNELHNEAVVIYFEGSVVKMIEYLYTD